MSIPSDQDQKGTPSQPDGQDEGPKPHPIIKSLLGSKKPRDTLVVHGYLGSPDSQGFVRIYMNLSLQAYLLIEWKRVLHADSPDPAEESRPTKIVIEAGEPLRLVQTLDASFLQGPIASGYPIATPVGFGPDCCIHTWFGCAAPGKQHQTKCPDKHLPRSGAVHSPLAPPG